MSYSELLRSYIHSFMNRLQSSNNLILSSICESTVPIYSNIWTWWYDMLILPYFTSLYYIIVNLL